MQNTYPLNYAEYSKRLYAVLGETVKPLRRPMTADGVESVIRSRGIRGRRGHSCECAVAEYVRAQLSDVGFPGLEVESFTQFIGGTCRGHLVISRDADVVVSVSLSPVVATFMEMFDAGHFPGVDVEYAAVEIEER